MASPPVHWYPSVSRVLAFIGALFVLLGAFGVHFPVVDVVDLGLAIFILSFVL